ncbi:hypothetical protein [Butyrivibrio proteoclasticus]|nr:hypothetical protein [Butyrivibrio proteoclasticus]
MKLAEKAEKTFPDGHLRVSRNKRQTRYYKMTDSADKVGEYLPMKESDKIKTLAQKDYNKHFLKTAKAEMEMLDKFLQKYKISAENTYNNLIPERKNLVTPYILTDDLIVKEWQSKTFKPNPYKPEHKIHDTKRGEKVRSKSEAFIADTLYEFGIPYRYEYPVKMFNGEIKYPDFTILKVKTREIIYFEHFGKMGDEGYRIDTMEKMDLYRASGIYPGKNLIFTYETENNPLDIKGMRKMLHELFCECE